MKSVTVLVVEDEFLIRSHAMDVIEEVGDIAVSAANADAALQILSHRSDIDVVFTDINMPGTMDGLQLAHEIHNRWPSIRLILTSGKTEPKDEEMSGDGRFIRKPYLRQDLSDALKFHS